MRDSCILVPAVNPIGYCPPLYLMFCFDAQEFVKKNLTTAGATSSDTRFCYKFLLELSRLVGHTTAAVRPPYQVGIYLQAELLQRNKQNLNVRLSGPRCLGEKSLTVTPVTVTQYRAIWLQ